MPCFVWATVKNLNVFTLPLRNLEYLAFLTEKLQKRQIDLSV